MNSQSNSKSHINNSEYFNENNIPKYDDIVEYENNLRKEIENTSPLVSDKLNIEVLLVEYENSIFEHTLQSLKSKYSSIRYIRRDGNCFYRAYLYRLFENICMENDNSTYKNVLFKVETSRKMLENNGFEWLVVEDFYNIFLSELKFMITLNGNEKLNYLNLLFSDREKGNYMITYMRMLISSYIKENRILYENFIFDEDLDSWCRREVEPIDVECDNIQIIAVTNCFDVGVLIESLGEKRIDIIKFPEDLNEDKIFIRLLFRPGHYDVLYK
jgi:ubiquitin thioesterase protein OTUB1